MMKLWPAWPRWLLTERHARSRTMDHTCRSYRAVSSTTLTSPCNNLLRGSQEESARRLLPGFGPRWTVPASGIDPHQAAGTLVVEQLDIGVDHDLDELGSKHLGLPPQQLLS